MRLDLYSRVLRLTLFVFVLMFAVTAISADDLDGISFEGLVRDTTGALVIGAKITVRHSSSGVERHVTSNSTGSYRITISEPGDYSIVVEATGFREELINILSVTTGRKVARDFTLAPIGIREEVTIVESNPPPVDTSRTVVGGTVSQQELDELPIAGRDPLQLVFLLAGVTEAPLSTADLADEGRGRFFRGTPEEAGLLSLTGAPATSNNLTIDGLDNNDDRTARERITLNPESVAELQIITNQYAAEYGRASGGRINIRTRAGGNAFKGEAYFYFGDESLNANTFFRNARGLGRIPQQQLREGLVFSGPIRRQRAFFHASYERFNVSDFAEINTLVPVASNPLFPLPAPNQPFAPGSEVGPLIEEVSTPEIRNLINVRSDLNISDAHNASLRFDMVHGGNKRGFPGGDRLAESILIEGRNSDSIGISDNLILSNHLINQFRFQYSRLLPRNSSNTDAIGVIINEPARVVAGAFTGSDAAPALMRQERRLQFQDSISLALRNHLLKTGGDLQLVRSTFTDLFAAGGQYEFDSVQGFLTSLPSRFVQRFNTTSSVPNNVTGLFIQDEWKLRTNLTFSFGIRWDNESVLDDRDNFSPRIAIAWDPFGATLFRRFKRMAQPGKTVVRAGLGMFYNRALLRTLDDFSLGRSTTIVDSAISPEVLAAVRFPEPITDRSLIDRFGLKEASFLRRVSPSIEIPYTIQSGLGIERQIGRHTTATADYIFVRGAHLWRETNINAPVLPPQFADFTSYLQSRDFDNRRGPDGTRPITGASADVVRFDLGANSSTTPGAIKVENGVRLLTLGLNAPRSTNIAAALNALRPLRPDPALTQVEMLESTGSSFYHGGLFSVRYWLGRRATLRAAYTLSKFIDEGTTNTASPQNLLDRRAERSLSLQDQRHRFTLSGVFEVPVLNVDVSPIISFGSSRPFNIGAGFDRNLNDIPNDRPNFVGDLERPEWRRPGDPPSEVKDKLQLAPIGSNGNLPRNYGLGPATSSINLRVSRVFRPKERVSLRTVIEAFNLFNNTVFSFGSEFIDRDSVDFLVPARTQRPRTVQLGLKILF
jgi:carboxypeptidase family protein/TonB-dependent receptor-like protein